MKNAQDCILILEKVLNTYENLAAIRSKYMDAPPGTAEPAKEAAVCCGAFAALHTGQCPKATSHCSRAHSSLPRCVPSPQLKAQSQLIPLKQQVAALVNRYAALINLHAIDPKAPPPRPT